MSNFTESFSSDYDKGKEIYDWCYNVVFELFNGFLLNIKIEKPIFFVRLNTAHMRATTDLNWTTHSKN